MPLITLLDIAKANGSDQITGLIDETAIAYPELTRVAARTIKGTNYKTLVRTGLPTAGFRNANEGRARQKSTLENRLVETFILDIAAQADKAVADRYEDGAAAYFAIEQSGQAEANFQLLSKQFYYGNAGVGDAKGHPGLIQSHDATNNVVDAGGTTASTGSSVWMVRMGVQGVQWVLGANGSFEASELMEETVLDANGNPYRAYTQNILAYPGLQVGSVRSVVRIKKLTEDSGKGLTDKLLNAGLAKFPAGIDPDVIFLSLRSARQLTDSRTATTPTGTPAPWPNSIVGINGKTIPLVVTGGIQDTESLTL